MRLHLVTRAKEMMDSSAPPGGGARDVYLPQREGPSRRGVGVALLALLIIAGYFLLSRLSGARNPSAQVSPAARPGVPVSAAEVKRGDLDRYLSAIGTVTAFNTVTVKTRVDGQIVNVAFKEGQTVHQGDLLVEIDPRPYQAALAQAEG
jgi:membrane fusion protein, multidrug efflux system